MILFERSKKITIRIKMIGLVLVIILLLTLVHLEATRRTLESALTEQLEQRAVSIARDVASRSIDFIYTNNRYSLYRLARDTLENNTDLRYVFFLDGAGKVLAHTFDQGFPGDLPGANRLEENGIFSLRTFQTEEGVLRDIAVSVFDAQGETVRIGILDRSLQDALKTATRRILINSTAAFCIAGSLVYLLTTATAIRPINAIMTMVRSVSQGDLSVRVSINTGDEFSELAGALNNMTANLDKSQKERTSLVKKMIGSQEDERRRIARELHDETGQSLATLLIGIRLIEESASVYEVMKRVGEFRPLLLQTLDNVRLLAWKMSPIPLAGLGLQVTLETMLDKYARKEDWAIETEFKGLTREKLSLEQETAVYRIIQEALNNAAKHAGAAKIRLTVDCSDAEIVVELMDDGKGFNVNTLERADLRKESLGIASMQERAAVIGGALTIKSAPSEGTRLLLKAPI